MTTTVVGRDEEPATIRTFLGRIEQGPCALVLAGEPGNWEDDALEGWS
jgi:hypothetical protein